jgi:hypothetical protein
MRTPFLITVALVTALGACADDAPQTSTNQPADETVVGTTDTDTTTTTTTTTTDTTTDTTNDTTNDTATDTDDVTEPPDGDATDADTAADRTDAGATVAAVDTLDTDEVAGLFWMREEEQLAHDVYVALGDEWGLRVFENIAASEQQHIDAVVGLLDRYGLADPAAGNQPGTFTDPTIQELYDELVARGLQSKQDALEVGATIEELDIVDLRQRAEATDEAAIDDVYARLERGSRNHLRAFVGQLDLLGVEYAPTLLTDFDEIVAAPMERGRGGGH